MRARGKGLVARLLVYPSRGQPLAILENDVPTLCILSLPLVS
jgi:hypothetical protein